MTKFNRALITLAAVGIASIAQVQAASPMVVKFAPSLDAVPNAVRFNNHCATAVRKSHSRTSQGFCTAALRGLRNLQRTESVELAPQAQAAILSNAAVMYLLSGDVASARSLIAEAAMLAPDADFVVRNQSLIAAGV
jgi:hypothetical protein